eukprot:CAMPEP_0202687044 /NCGR_PEP_ID=MMETSP1385-20130828/2753_1 /ASSEMBLY_ACC=CAM_ASM_000861 /TAXON_ID=933848 /ORGANISM="Elphidium margaritaceum" /LENGTH=357 /DNA_ID=CAMNT_0049341757 /DNA_START=48 /DNA_END=1121 /DNA_ORIENTATION=+
MNPTNDTAEKFSVLERPQLTADDVTKMHWIFCQRLNEPEQPHCIKHIKRVSRNDTDHAIRKRPQWITSYHEKDETLLVWICGTANEWDWRNLLNICHKEIKLSKPTSTIKVHNGVYNAINNELFYTALFADIHIHFQDEQQPIKRVYFGGHSQGGAIAQLMYMLWSGHVDCDFVNYFKEQTERAGIVFDIEKVYTLGAVSVVSHKSMVYTDHLFGARILNLININDPIPRMYGGNQCEPKTPLKKSNKRGIATVCINQYGKSILDNFHKIASFGPIGRFIILAENELHVVHRTQDHSGVFHEHLVNGAHNYFHSIAKKTKRDVFTLMRLQRHHLYTSYKENLERVFGEYMKKLSHSA